MNYRKSFRRNVKRGRAYKNSRRRKIRGYGVSRGGIRL